MIWIYKILKGAQYILQREIYSNFGGQTTELCVMQQNDSNQANILTD